MCFFAFGGGGAVQAPNSPDWGATLAAGRDPSGAISAPQAVDATTYPRTGSGAGRAARGVERWRLPHLVPLGRTSPRRLVLGAGAIDLGARPRPKLVRRYLKYGMPARAPGGALAPRELELQWAALGTPWPSRVWFHT
ncbi:hypothetical protein ACCO45_004097 [Purpureocillium lilacinum]|uniref:Uncharacterized protein n=1 Tax=Purpureocillium lilacinum TaxID=33203 RepID=A0ACC4E363_PURLI